MLRLEDFQCSWCKMIDEYMIVVGDAPPECCGEPMTKVWRSAPQIDCKSQYSHALGRKISSYRELDKELEKKGQWVASKTEANRVYDTDIFDDNVTVKKATEEQTRKHVEKAARKLVADGKIRSGPKGWEATSDSI